MEKERLLQDDQDTVPALPPEGKERSCSHLPNTLSKLCAFLLLSSVCCNCTLIWLLARQQHTSDQISEYGPSISMKWRLSNI